jgi:beta-lactamase class A
MKHVSPCWWALPLALPVLLVAAACGPVDGPGPTAPPPSPLAPRAGKADGPSDGEASTPSSPTRLATALSRIADEAGWRSPGTELAIAVQDLVTGEQLELAGDVPHVSASSAKAIWVAAALAAVGVGPVAPHADPIFRNSDNFESGAVIDLIGPDAVNDFMWNSVGMTHSALTSWSFGRTRLASNSPRELGSDNYFTARDVLRFLVQLGTGSLLPGEPGEALQRWMTLSPRTGVGGWLLARLPGAVRVSGMHKGGWLPPGCCSDDAVYNTLNEIGLVETPAGRYAVAILARRGHDYWGRQTALVEHASCEIYRAVSGDDALDCARVGDPSPAEVAPPPGPPASGCGDVSYEGFCDGAQLTWCETDGSLRTVDCAARGKACAYQDAAVGFNCL